MRRYEYDNDTYNVNLGNRMNGYYNNDCVISKRQTRNP